MQEHRQAGAREQLTARWKLWVASDSFDEKIAATRKADVESAGEDISVCDDLRHLKMERPWAWLEQTVESRARPASCDAIFKVNYRHNLAIFGQIQYWYV